MPVYLIIFTVIVFFCVLCNKISSRLGIPTLLAFIVLGMFFGSDGVVKIAFDDYAFAEQACSIALIFIMFYGGFGTKWNEAKPVAGKAVLLSSLGVVMTAGVLGLFCFLVLRIELLESMLIGAVISSTDAASVFSILRAKRLNLKDRTASLLEVESGSNDPFSYMLTVIILSVMGGGLSGGQFAYLLFSQLVYGVLFGVGIAYAALCFLKRFHFETDGFDAAFVVAVAVLSYAAPAAVGGNGYLSAYIVGIVLGNSAIHNKKSLVHFFDGVTGLMQMLIFFLLGLLAFPSEIPKILPLAIAVALFLTFVARPLCVFIILSPLRCAVNQQLLVSWAGLRGAASIVFAVMATIHPAYTKHDIFHIVFCIVLFSIALQGSLIPFVARKLKMFDDNADVLKTFNDYSEETPVQFIRLSVSAGHKWIGRKIKEIQMPPDLLLALLLRGKERIIPRGNTMILEGDILILSALAYSGEAGDIELTEILLGKGHEWIGNRLSQILLEPGKLVMMIKRGEKVVIPRGEVTLKLGDILVINRFAP